MKFLTKALPISLSSLQVLSSTTLVKTLSKTIQPLFPPLRITNCRLFTSNQYTFTTSIDKTLTNQPELNNQSSSNTTTVNLIEPLQSESSTSSISFPPQPSSIEPPVDYSLHQTDESLSIFSKIPGIKPHTPPSDYEMYILSFTCNKCETKSIRSFTKHAYHNGVVMIRCGGCVAVHLVADNLGWFSDEVINVETMCKEVKKVDDRNVIMEFLNTAFGDQKDKEEVKEEKKEEKKKNEEVKQKLL